MDQAEVFRTLKPVCVRLSDEALKTSSGRSTANNVAAPVEELLRVLKSLRESRKDIDERLVNYIFFPLSHIFKDRDKFTLRSLELALRCLEILLLTGWRTMSDPNTGIQLLMMLTFMSEQRERTPTAAGDSDDVVVAALDCLSALFQSVGQSLACKRSLCNESNMPAAGHAVTVLLERLRNSGSGHVQMSAMDALQAFCTSAADADAMQSFAPGILSALSHVLTPKTKLRRSYMLLAKGLSVLASIVRQLFSDHAIAQSSGNVTVGDSASSENGWTRTAAAQTRIVFANVVKLRNHDRVEVRSALLRLCWIVLEECHVTLSDSVPIMLETVGALSFHERDESNMLRLRRISSANGVIEEHVKSSAYKALLSLPRVITSSDGSAIPRLTGTIGAWLSVLVEDKMEMTVIDKLFHQTLRDTLLNLVGQSNIGSNTGDGSKEAQASLGMLYHGTGILNEPTEFQSIVPGNKDAQSSLDSLQRLLRIMSRSSGALEIASIALESSYDEIGDARLVDVWICYRILQSRAQDRADLDALLNTDLADDQEVNLRNDLYALAVSLLKQQEDLQLHDWRMQAVALEVLAFQAGRMQQEFRNELADTLYPVIHLLGSSVQPLRTQALSALDAIAAACEYSDVKDMLIANVDYVVNSVSLKINTLDISSHTSKVLLMMIKICGPTLIPYLDDLFDGIFDALECYHGYPALVDQLFAVLQGTVDEGVKSFPADVVHKANLGHWKAPVNAYSFTRLVTIAKTLWGAPGNGAEDGESADGSKSSQKVQEQGKGERRQKQSEQSGKDNYASEAPLDDDETRPGSDEVAETPKTSKTPRIHSVLQRIAALTQHYLPSSSASTRAALLSLLSRAIPVLASDEDIFLPLVHTLWPALLPRLADKEAFVVAAVLEVMGHLCQGAGDFMSTRVEGLWPTISKIYDECTRSSLSRSEKSPRSLEATGRLLPNFGDSQVTSYDSQAQLPSSATSLSNLVPQSKELEQVQMRSQSRRTAAAENHYLSTTNQTIEASLMSFVVQLINNVRVSEDIYFEVLSKMLHPSVLWDEKRLDLKKALTNVNPDAVMLVVEKTKLLDECQDIAAKDRRWSELHLPPNVAGGPKFCITFD